MDRVRILCVLISILIGPIAARSQYRCRLPDGTSSSCVNIGSCKNIVDFVSKNEVTDEVRNLLLKYKCDDDGYGNTKVCCPSSVLKLPATQDFSTHRNINLLPLDCGQSSLNKITNGNKTSLFEYPWAVALRFTGGSTPFLCGGSLINNRYVLTAAHCAKGPYQLVGVRLGEHDFKNDRDCTLDGGKWTCAEPPQNFDISENDVVVHPRYNNKTYENDIALIRLRRQAVNSESVAPICLPITVPEQTSNFKEFTVIGWGTTEEYVPSSILLKVRVPKVEQSNCAEVYSSRSALSDKQLCAGGRNSEDSCNGDSGGPLFADFVSDGEIKTIQYGIVSFGPRVCGVAKVPVVYTKVVKYVGWILDNIRA